MTPKPTKAFTELFLAGTALFVSLSTLAVYVYQSKVMREQQHVSVWPCLEWNTTNVGDYHITVQNKGVGPAIVRKVEMFLDGKPVEDNPALIRAVMGPGADPAYHNSTLQGRVMLPGEAITPLSIPGKGDAAEFDAKVRGHQLDLRITYCSVYGERWVTDRGRLKRLPDEDLGLF